MTVFIRYWTDDATAYWTVNDGVFNWPHDVTPYCANTYATFRGDRIGERQVYGPARSPLNAKNIRNWFISEYGGWNRRYPVKFSVRRVKTIDELEVACDIYDREVA
jgi:hypothetical protein